MSRVRRVRAISAPPAATTTRVRRVRPLRDGDGRSWYVVDWGLSLEAKLQLYLMTSYQYYRLNRSIITDHDYDRLCRELYEGWPRIRHQHKRYVDRQQLFAGTGYAIDYPHMVIGGAMRMLELHRER